MVPGQLVVELPRVVCQKLLLRAGPVLPLVSEGARADEAGIADASAGYDQRNHGSRDVRDRAQEARPLELAPHLVVADSNLLHARYLGTIPIGQAREALGEVGGFLAQADVLLAHRVESGIGPALGAPFLAGHPRDVAVLIHGLGGHGRQYARADRFGIPLDEHKLIDGVRESRACCRGYRGRLRRGHHLGLRHVGVGEEGKRGDSRDQLLKISHGKLPTLCG